MTTGSGDDKPISLQEGTPLLGNLSQAKDSDSGAAKASAANYGRSVSYDQPHRQPPARHARHFSEGRPQLTRDPKSSTSTFRLDSDVHDIRTESPTRKAMFARNLRVKEGVGGTKVVTVDFRGMMEGKERIMHNLLLLSCYLLCVSYSLMIVLGPLVLLFIPKSQWCVSYDEEHENRRRRLLVEDAEYSNPDYITDPCRYERLAPLAWLTLEECDMSRRMLTSVLLGAVIGYERRSADRPAGIRTMGLVSLGSCFFTISSIMAFKSSTMGWDSSRVTAAIPSGVGFLGAGLIWKGQVGEGHQVHGLTTAGSVWLSAAIGAGAGGGLYFVSVYTTILIVMVLRYGPRLYLQEDNTYQEEEEEETTAEETTEEEEPELPKKVAFEVEDKDFPFSQPPPPVPLAFRHSTTNARELLGAALPQVSFQSERGLSRRKSVRKRKAWQGPSFAS